MDIVCSVILCSWLFVGKYLVDPDPPVWPGQEASVNQYQWGVNYYRQLPHSQTSQHYHNSPSVKQSDKGGPRIPDKDGGLCTGD